jgi:hypothetical protein
MIWNPYFIKDGKVHLMQKMAVVGSKFGVLGACGETSRVESINWGDPDLGDENECEECSDVYVTLFKKAWNFKEEPEDG